MHMPVGQPVAFYMHCIPSESTHMTLSFFSMQLSMDAIGIVVHHFPTRKNKYFELKTCGAATPA